MLRVLKESGHNRREGFGPGLQDGPKAALDLLGAAGERAEEVADGLADLGAVPKQVLAVTSARAQPQVASSALKSRL